ncbi:SDR family oxidoreductase [Granulicella sp. L46]|uniref:SDR family oxidoreductase n=1 Tax=Granulicella sp. L46 TaxID=1641865 RepID=UPI00131BE92A|nr:SDR family oxidoreductase [Granulicella sp. L46]
MSTEVKLPLEEEQPLALRTPRADEAGVGEVAAEQTHGPRRILVLGATSGIAEACIRLWANRGDALYLVARNEDKLAVVAADARTRGASHIGSAVANLDDTNAHPEVLAHAINSLGGLDVAFLALGVLGEQPEAEKNFAAADQILHTNFVAPVSLLTWLANYAAQRHAGTLAVLSSVAGERGRKSNYVYGSSKAGLTAFVDGLRNRIDRDGVRVMTIKPGPVKTAMTEGMKGSGKFADVEAVAASLVKAIDRGDDVVYVPGIWRVIMAVIRAIPERVFKKMNL